jgi:tape measure domain-containing protein
MTAVEFIISLKDKASSTIDKIASEFSRAKSSSDKLTGSIDSLKSKSDSLRIMRDSSSSISEIRRLNGEIQKTEHQLDKLNNAGNKPGMFAGLKNAFNQIPGAAFFTNPIVAIGAGAVYISSLGIAAEKTAVSFEVLLGSQQKASKMISEIKAYGDVTPYESPALLDNAKMMLSFGIAQQKILPDMKMMGDIAMGDAEKMKSLTLAFSQISSAGKMQGQDLLQLVNVGFNPLNELSKMTGKSMATLRKEMESGKISAEMVEKAFQHATGPMGMFYKMSEKMALTVGGRLSTLIDLFKKTMLQLYDVIAPFLIPAVTTLTFLLTVASDSMTWLTTAFKEGNPWVWGIAAGLGYLAVALGIYSMRTKIAAAFTAIKVGWDFVSTVATGGLTAAIWAQNAAWMANPLVWIIGLIALLVAGFVMAWKKFDGFRAAIKATWEVIKDFGGIIKDYIIDRIKGIITGLGSIAKAIGLLFKGQFGEAWKEAKKGADDLVGYSAAKRAITDTKKLIIATPEIYKEKYANEKAIAKAGVPGQEDKNKQEKPANKNTTEAVASGGTRNTSINVTLKNLVENIVFQGGISENRTEVEKQVTEALLRVLYAAQSAG